MDTKSKILSTAAEVFAISGYEGLSMRALARQTGITQSVLYYYFDSKETLLKDLFNYLNSSLGAKRKTLKKIKNASMMLRQRIEFQIDNAKEIVAVIKYFIYNRRNFPKFQGGFTPDKTSLHMEEVLELGRKTAEFKVYNLKQQAKIMTHTVNGFLLEYFPYKLDSREKRNLVNSIHKFLIKSLQNEK